MKLENKINSWYLNKRRTLQLLSEQKKEQLFSRIESRSGVGKAPLESTITDCYQVAIMEYLKSNNVPTLQELILGGNLNKGAVFVYEGTFICKGLSKSCHPHNVSESSEQASIYAEISLDQKYNLMIDYHPIHLVSSSAWEKLRNKTDLFIFGYISEIESSDEKVQIKAVPTLFADLYISADEKLEEIVRSHGEIFIESIDSFEKVQNEPPVQKNELKKLKVIPENDIKKAFAEIIGEEFTTKDWGGEASDLYSSRVVIQGERVSTAYILKGPAKFQRMTTSVLGKNGDQISRLYTEPANLLIIQHCHEIGTDVRLLARAFANQVGNQRLYCIIDGCDTIRILKAYGKCGFTPNK